MQIRSNAFEHEEKIPSKYTCEGVDISPEISWSGAPKETKSFALICEDPDAPVGLWVHWVIFNIPADTTKLPEAMPTSPVLGDGSKQGKNDFGKIGYGGPCPPPGHGYHRYFFKLSALDTMLDLKEKTTRKELLHAMKGHVLVGAELMGRYKR